MELLGNKDTIGEASCTVRGFCKAPQKRSVVLSHGPPRRLCNFRPSPSPTKFSEVKVLSRQMTLLPSFYQVCGVGMGTLGGIPIILHAVGFGPTGIISGTLGATLMAQLPVVVIAPLQSIGALNTVVGAVSSPIIATSVITGSGATAMAIKHHIDKGNKKEQENKLYNPFSGKIIKSKL
ncbi:hypothetical protein CYY_005237 [Polysphondylium violaceum]|uniref:Uncharacterized protein n=1 Tax=Polysphondylium violaceum TaxID=133409 RepID=A0A8J4PUQ6_9MYCE|nr:hypothetical protein CYY_005237 [Polysphondylium violaceum]